MSNNYEFNESEKFAIETAIWKTYIELKDSRFLSLKERSDEYEDEMQRFLHLTAEFLKSRISLGRNLPPGSSITPDIVIEERGVIEIKVAKKNNLSSGDWNQIKKYVKTLKLPGAFVLFDPAGGYPERRWTRRDNDGEIEMVYAGNLTSKPPEPSSSNYTKSEGCSSLVPNNVIRRTESSSEVTSYSYSSSESNNGTNTVEAAGIVLGVAAAAAAIGGLTYLALNEKKMNFSSSDKSSIKNAVFATHRTIGSSADSELTESVLTSKLRREYPFRYVSRYYETTIGIPDILIKGVGVIEIKNRRWSNMNSGNKAQIEKYMEELSLPGAMINFDPAGEPPYVRWYRLNSSNEAIMENRENVTSAGSDDQCVIS